MAWPTLTLRIAFGSDPMDAVPVWTTITNDVRRIRIGRGRQHELNRMEAGTMSLELLNIHGNYWPLNAGGAYFPNVLPGKRVNLYAVYNAVTYPLYTGFIEDWNPDWLEQIGGLIPVVRPDCADLINNLANFDINSAGYPQELSGARVGKVLDEINWPAGARDLDAGQSQMQATGALADVNAMEHLFLVQKSELGIIYIASDGDIQFEDRHHRLVAPHTVSQGIFGDDLGENFYHGMEPKYGSDEIRNDIRITRSGGAQQSATDAASQTDYGKRSLSRTGLLMTTDLEASDQAHHMLRRYKDPALRNRLLKLIPERDPGRLWPHVLGREISDRITVRRNEANIDSDYMIEGITYDIDLVNHTWEVYWQLSDAESQQFWMIGIAGFSEIGETTWVGY